MLVGGQSRTCVLGTTSLLILALHVLPVAASTQGPVHNKFDERTLRGDLTESSRAKGSKKEPSNIFDSADEDEDEDEGEGEDMVQRKGKGKGKGKKRRGKRGRRSKDSKPSYDGCPCFDAKDIDEHWHMAKDKHMDDNLCDYVEYEEDGNEAACLLFMEASDDGAGFQFCVANDNNIGECEVSVYYDPPKGDAEVDRSVTGMGFKNMEVTDHCIDEMQHSAMYQECME